MEIIPELETTIWATPKSPRNANWNWKKKIYSLTFIIVCFAKMHKLTFLFSTYDQGCETSVFLGLKVPLIVLAIAKARCGGKSLRGVSLYTYSYVCTLIILTCRLLTKKKEKLLICSKNVISNFKKKKNH
jgi:hypothetical protein